MKKLLLILCILSNSIQIFCSYEKLMLQELCTNCQYIKREIIEQIELALNEETDLEKIVNKMKNLNPNGFSNFINYGHINQHHTFLEDAIWSNNPEKVQLLIDLGVDVHLRNRGIIYYNSLMWAARFKADKTIPLLITAGADVNHKDEYGDTPLHFAVEHNHDRIIKLLIDAGAKINLPNKSNQTPLHYAAVYNADRAISLLIGANANINHKDERGLTPLHLAVYAGAHRAIELLIAAGADTTIKGRFIGTARECIQPDYITHMIFDRAVTQRKEKLAAATKIQAVARGFLTRENLKNEIEN
ncbi:MAG: ankyrin repeat domain-containing protein [Candidatus Dependentiae bacterium]|nr:ankyrin repeat domain-containing protein [Candidatus Dependentiae bacterium]